MGTVAHAVDAFCAIYHLISNGRTDFDVGIMQTNRNL
jgi:hypothetical protein